MVTKKAFNFINKISSRMTQIAPFARQIIDKFMGDTRLRFALACEVSSLCVCPRHQKGSGSANMYWTPKDDSSHVWNFVKPIIPILEQYYDLIDPDVRMDVSGIYSKHVR